MKSEVRLGERWSHTGRKMSQSGEREPDWRVLSQSRCVVSQSQTGCLVLGCYAGGRALLIAKVGGGGGARTLISEPSDWYS
jgi:hypothetical protein